MKKIAIIPARSGSKGLKDKNIIKVCGKPLMAYSIEAAINSKCFDKVIVTTDSEKYAEIAKKYGAEVILRGERLSNDNATSYMVIEDVIYKQSDDFDYFVLLQPTSPMRNELHIIKAIKKFENNIVDFDFLVSVKEAEHTADLIKPIDSDESLKYFDRDFSNYRRQSFKEYSPNGAIFIGKKRAIFTKKTFFWSKKYSIYYESD